MSSKSEISFTSEQLKLIELPGSQYVDACPGAGKTEALVERYIRRPNRHPRKGVALLSFTNAAIDEARARCGASPELLLAPNFVGTIDKFINRFIVTPVHATISLVSTKFVDVWSQLPHTTVKCAGVSVTAALEWFEIDEYRNAKLNAQRAPIARRSALRNLEDWKTTRLEQRASVIFEQMIHRGYHDASSARQAALAHLRDSNLRETLAALVTSRFSEVMVDEVQDCSDEDVVILEWLREAGPELVLVGDPDQSIFDFRGRSPQASHRLQALVPKGTRLAGNFRSSPAVCRLANSLRSTSSSVDEAVGQHRANSTPVLLFRYNRPNQVAKQALKLVGSRQFSPSECAVVAHSSRQAASCAGGSISDTTTGARLARIAEAFDCLTSDSTPPQRRATALADLAVCIHECADEPFRDLSPSEFHEALGVTQREHREKLLRLAFSITVDRDQPPSVFKTSLFAGLTQHGISWVRFGSIRIPNGDQWPTRPRDKPALLEHGSIHSYKGLQRDFVVVVVPDGANRPDHETGVGQWCSGAPGEARRVLYVGATRAAQVLMLAVHDAVYERVHAKLVSDGVPFDEL